MARIIWNNNNNTGIQIIDNQHKKLAILFNQVNQMMDDGVDILVLKKILFEISQYVKYHFDTEEDLMLKANYFDIEAHKKQHLFFKEKINTLILDLDNKIEPIKISIDACNLLWEWFLVHINEVDRKYIDSINKIYTENTVEENSIIEKMAEHEEILMQLYLKYSEYLDNKDFWISLAAEEMQHAFQIRGWYRLILNNNIYLSKRFRLEAINLSLQHLKEKITLAEKKETDIINALGVSLDIEKSLLEKNFFESYESDSVEYKHEIDLMKKGIERHIKRVEEELINQKNILLDS